MPTFKQELFIIKNAKITQKVYKAICDSKVLSDDDKENLDFILHKMQIGNGKNETIAFCIYALLDKAARSEAMAILLAYGDPDEISIKLTSFSKHTNHVKGEIDAGEYKFFAKLSDENSEDGIGQGRVIKLSIRDFDGEEIISYDRGWCKEPKEEHVRMCKCVLLFLESAPRRFEN